MSYLDKYKECKYCPVVKYCGTMVSTMRLCNSYKKEENENNNDININYNMQQKKYKNIVLRPHKIPKEKHLIDINNFKEIDLKNNIRVNKNKKEESPELIKKKRRKKTKN